jgi:outer membrane protein assembly factor BamB
MTPPRAAPALLCLSLVLWLLLHSLLPGPPAPRPPWVEPAPAIQPLASRLHLQWQRQLPRPEPAWPDQPRMPFDAAARPVVLGTTLFLPCSRTDSVTACDLDTGAEKWHFRTDGPVRFAPAVWREPASSTSRVYFTSDDGYLYCVDADRGALLWKFRGGPSERKVLGNERLVSTWPARGGPVVADDTVYFAAGIWPFMGIFVHALDARTGAVVWTSDGDGSVFMKQPHQADAFAGVAPQGSLLVAGDRLLVPGGRSVPACYDRRTGKLLHFRLADNSKLGGGSEVKRLGPVFLNGGAAFDLRTGDHLGPYPEPTAAAGHLLFSCNGTQCVAYDTRGAVPRVEEAIDRKGKRVNRTVWKPARVASVPLPRAEALLATSVSAFSATGRLYVGAPGEVFAVELPFTDGKAKLSWRAAIEGRPVHLLAASGRLIVSTREGRVYCFGPTPCTPDVYAPPAPPMPERDEWTERAASILTATSVREGYCVVWGLDGGRLLTELVRQSGLRVIGVDPDPNRVAAVRDALIAAGLYGRRAAVLQADLDSAGLPPYLASLIVSERWHGESAVPDDETLRKLFAVLRPYGGVACLSLPAERRERLAALLTADTSLRQARVRDAGDWWLLVREGALPGSANWTHEHADAANTRVSRDQLVKAPLGLLWFGGPAHDGVLPRHGHGPQPQVIDGRLLIEGTDMLRALDVYTGRLLWEAPLPGVGKVYDNLAHQPGANAAGTNYVSTSDGIYIAHGRGCLRLDPASGKTLGSFRLPPLEGESEPPPWDHVNVWGDYLVAAVNPAPPAGKARKALSSCKHLAVLDRHTGRLLWRATAIDGFRNNTVCIGGGRLYVIDRPSTDYLAWLDRRGEKPADRARLVAFDLRSGKEQWAATANVFGTWLSYSAKHDVLVEAGRVARDTLLDEPKGMRAYRAADGKILWDRPTYTGPAMLHGDTILKEGSACDLLTGAPMLRQDPLTGKMVEWTWARTYGCNTPAASEHLLTFRSGAAGYFDLCHDGGTGNLGGFRSGCTNNLIVAGGVLTAADYTRTCTCSYQNQSSLALVPMPEAEMWTFYGPQTLQIKGPVRRAGINLGAPGNRKADDGTLWLEYPPAGPSPRLPITVTPSDADWFRRHSSHVEAGRLPWVGASGVRGLRSLTVTLDAAGTKPRPYTVRLYFCEPDHLEPGQRRFDVALQGKLMLSDLDVNAEAGGPNRTLVKEFTGVRVTRDLKVTLTPSESAPVGTTLLSGVEVLAEGW